MKLPLFDDHVAPGIINPERDGGESEDTVSKKRPDAYPAERRRGGETDTARGAGAQTHKTSKHPPTTPLLRRVLYGSGTIVDERA